jgi:type III pantothenate kinase
MIPAMLLLIDVGNTNATVGVHAAGALQSIRRAATRSAATTDELEVLLEGLLALDGLALADVSSIACCSVVPTFTAGLQRLATRRERPLLLAGAGNLPLAVRVERPNEVGADRLVNALAAHRLHPGASVVVDCGTATTVDAVGPDGAFLGGAIAPGLETGLDALASRTAKLPRIELHQPSRAIARDTVSAIQAGTVLGHEALVLGLVGRVRGELAELTGTDASRITTILTGGLSAAPWARSLGLDIVDPDLTLKGLALFHAEVRGGEPVGTMPT